MPYLKWSPGAIQGVQRACRFLAEKDREAAKAAADTIRKQAAILKQFPNAGRPADDLEPEHRELLIPFGGAGYVLLYRLDGEGTAVTVLAVRHQKEVGVKQQFSF
jgi:toxin ParE1/3/4